MDQFQQMKSIAEMMSLYVCAYEKFRHKSLLASEKKFNGSNTFGTTKISSRQG